MAGDFYYMGPSNFFKVFFLPNLSLEKWRAFGILTSRRDAVENETQLPFQPPAQSAETPPQSQEPPPPAEAAVPQQEPIVLSKLFPDAQQDLDTLFPDPQMKELLKEVHRNQQGNQRFLKRLNLSNLQADEDESPSEP
jgi:hypothetical protein